MTIMPRHFWRPFTDLFSTNWLEPSPPPPPPGDGKMLLEDGAVMLLEDGSKMLLE